VGLEPCVIYAQYLAVLRTHAQFTWHVIPTVWSESDINPTPLQGAAAKVLEEQSHGLNAAPQTAWDSRSAEGPQAVSVALNGLQADGV
jgi:hypothetical protein